MRKGEGKILHTVLIACCRIPLVKCIVEDKLVQ